MTHWTKLHRRSRADRTLLVKVLVNGHRTQGQLKLLLLFLGQPPLAIEGVHISLDPKHQMQEGLDQHTESYKAKESKDGGGDQGEKENAQGKGIEDCEEGHELYKRIQHLADVAEVLLFLLLENAVVSQEILNLAEGTMGGGHRMWFLGSQGGQ